MKSRGLPIALHASVCQLALLAFGPCRADLCAIALDPRKLPGRGTGTIVRADLDFEGRAALWLDCPAVDLDAVLCVEALRSLLDDAGYDPPSLQTDGDFDRLANRDGLRRTR